MRRSPLSLSLMIVLRTDPALSTCPADTDSGISYHFAFPKSGDQFDTGTLVIMTDVNATVVVSQPCGTSTYYPTPSAPSVITICSGAQYRDEGPDSGYIIALGRTDAAVPVLHVVFKVNHATHVTDDAFLVLPKNPDRRGNSYWSLGHRGTSGHQSRWLVSADSAMELNYKDCSDSATAVSLAANEVFQLSCATTDTLSDGTGSRLYSTNEEKFGFISGATAARVPVGIEAADVLAEMLPGEEVDGVQWWGTAYYVTEFNKAATGVQGDLIRIVSASASSNAVTFTPVSAGGAIYQENSSGHACDSTTGHTFTNAGEWCDILVEVGATITADAAILVGQMMKGVNDAGVGDPSLSLVLPTTRLRCGGRFFSFESFPATSGGNGSYVNIVAPSSAIANITLDGSTLSSATTCGGYSAVSFGGSPAYSWTKCLLADPAAGGSQHILDSGSTPIGVYVYGQKHAGSYAYVAGMSF